MDNVYQLLPYDLSGSRSKNRFRLELLWGLEKIYDIYKSGKDFCMVFDYVCDIELHLEDSYEFYQLKTSNGAKPFSISHILKLDDAGKSIFGKVYLLKHILDKAGMNNCKIAIVVNSPLRAKNKTYADIEELKFVDLDKEIKNIINESIKKELVCSEDINLSNVYYFHSAMDLVNPQDSLIGKTVQFFIDISGEEPKKVKSLFRVLQDTITIKATYEKQCNSNKDLFEKKGLSKAEFDKIIRTYIDIADDAVPHAKKIIDDYYIEFSDRVYMKNALTKVVQELVVNKRLQIKQEEIVKYIGANLQEFNKTISENLSALMKIFSSTFPLEYSFYEKQALIILILAKFEEGIYEAVVNS